MVVVRPGTIGPHPAGAETKWKTLMRGFLVARGMDANRGPTTSAWWGGSARGRKCSAGVAGRRSKLSKASWSSVRPNPLEDAMDVARTNDSGSRHNRNYYQSRFYPRLGATLASETVLSRKATRSSLWGKREGCDFHRLFASCRCRIRSGRKSSAILRCLSCQALKQSNRLEFPACGRYEKRSSTEARRSLPAPFRGPVQP